MKPQLLTRLACLTSVAAVMAGNAYAQEANYYYFGLSAGQSHSQLNATDTTNSLLGGGNGATVQGQDQQDTSYKIFGGYQFNRNFALEAGYFKLGKFSYNATSPTGTFNGSHDVDGINLDMIGTIPLGESLSAFARIGAQYANTSDSFSGTGSLIPNNRNPNKHDTNLKVGLGLQYEFSPSMQLRGEAERYRINDGLDNRGDVNVFSMALVFPIGRKAATRVAVAAPVVYVMPVERVEPQPIPVAKVTPPPVVAPIAPMPPPPKRVQLSADSMFNFDNAVISANGKIILDNFAKDTAGVKFDSISVEGNADRLGKSAYNEKLSLQRAEAVKAYLSTTPQLQFASISASGKGESNPMTKAGECVGTKATKALIACLQPDRRVDVEMSGMR